MSGHSAERDAGLRERIATLAETLDREADGICPVGVYDKKDKAWRVAHVRRRVAEDLRAILAEACGAPLKIRIAHGYGPTSSGLSAGTEHEDHPIVYDPALPTLGETRTAPFGPTPYIVLREWNEQVLLHEVLHVLLDGKVPTTEDDPHGHKTISHVEAALYDAGWRFRPTATSVTSPGGSDA